MKFLHLGILLLTIATIFLIMWGKPVRSPAYIGLGFWIAGFASLGYSLIKEVRNL